MMELATALVEKYGVWFLLWCALDFIVAVLILKLIAKRRL